MNFIIRMVYLCCLTLNYPAYALWLVFMHASWAGWKLHMYVYQILYNGYNYSSSTTFFFPFGPFAAVFFAGAFLNDSTETSLAFHKYHIYRPKNVSRERYLTSEIEEARHTSVRPKQLRLLDHIALRHVLPFTFAASLQLSHIAARNHSLTALNPEVTQRENIHSFQPEHEEHFSGPD